MKNTQHTPTPWQNQETDANATHVVHCVNTHEALVEALSDYLNRFEDLDRPAAARARAALAAARK